MREDKEQSLCMLKIAKREGTDHDCWALG